MKETLLRLACVGSLASLGLSGCSTPDKPSVDKPVSYSTPRVTQESPYTLVIMDNNSDPFIIRKTYLTRLSPFTFLVDRTSERSRLADVIAYMRDQGCKIAGVSELSELNAKVEIANSEGCLPVLK